MCMPCSRSQPGVKAQFKGPSGAFVTYCKKSCCRFKMIFETGEDPCNSLTVFVVLVEAGLI